MSGMFQELSSSGPFSDSDMSRIETRSLDEENMVINFGACPASSWKAVSHFDGLPDRHAKDMQAVCRHFRPQQEMTNKECAWWLTHLMDCLMSRACPTVPFFPQNKTVPGEFFADDDRLLRHVWQVLDEVAFGYFQEMVGTGAMSSFVGEILDFAESAARGENSAPKLLLYSGHDTGPMEPLSVAFELRNDPPYWPAFASMIVLEVWQAADGPIARWVVDGHVAAAGTMPFEDFHQKATAITSYAPRCYDLEGSSPHAASLALSLPAFFAGAPAMVASVALLVVVGLGLSRTRRNCASAPIRAVARDCRAIELCRSVDAALPGTANEHV